MSPQSVPGAGRYRLRAGSICLAGLVGLAGLLWLVMAGSGELHTEDWTIEAGETVELEDEVHELEGNLTVKGTLTLDNVTLRFGEPNLKLVVESGGVLELVGGTIEAEGLANYTATIQGKVNADDTIISGFNNAWAVDEGGSLEFNSVTLDGTDEVWGLKAKYAAKLRLDGVTFKGMTEAALVTYGNPGRVTAAVYDMGNDAVQQEHYFAATLELKEGEGVVLTNNTLQIIDGNDEIAVAEFWAAGGLELEVPSWTRVDGQENESRGPYSYRIGWSLRESGGSGPVWGQVIWEDDLDWTTQGSDSPFVTTLENPALDFTLTQVQVATEKPTKWEDLAISAVINNPNPVYLHTLNLGLYYNSLPMTWVKITDLEPQGSKAFNVTWESVHMSGTLELTLKIDPDGKISQWTDRGVRDKTVEVTIGSSIVNGNGGDGWWIAVLVLLFLAGLILYAVMTNLKLVEGLKEGDESDLEARERKLAEREREFERRRRERDVIGPDEEADGSGDSGESPGEAGTGDPDPEERDPATEDSADPARDPGENPVEDAAKELSGKDLDSRLLDEIEPPYPINGTESPDEPGEPDARSQE